MDIQLFAGSRKPFSTSTIGEVFGADYQFDAPQVPLAPIRRIALCAESFFPRFDGVAQHVYNTLRYLQYTGREVMVFAPDDAPRQIGPSQVIPLPSVGFPKYSGLRVGLPVTKIIRQLGRFQPDLIQLFGPTFFSARAISFGRSRKIPMVATYETNLPQYATYYGMGRLQGAARRWLRFLHNHCNLTLVPSKHTLNQLQDAGYQHLVVWRYGVNEQRFNPVNRSDEWRARLLNMRDPSALLCIYVGRLAREKNVESLLTIAQMPGVALTIIGDGPSRRQLETTFQGTHTYFTGCMFGSDLAHAYASADVFVFPSQSETFGLVTVEAMASGAPVVICRQGGGPDVVMHGESGFVCDSPEAFVRPVQQLRDDASLRARMAQNARRAALQNTWNRQMAPLEGHYLHAIGAENG
jgi:phosphatidylinositol alpha 1,6-mannosyltransferase